MVVTESTAEAASEGSRYQIRRILPDGRSFPFVRPHPGPSSSSSPTLMSVIGLVEELGVVDGDVVVFTDELAFRVDSETSGWDTPTTFRSDSSTRKYVDVITGAGGAAVLLADTDPDLDGQATIVVTRDAVEWTDVVIAERLSNPQLRALGDHEVVIEGFRIGVGTIRFAIPLDQ